MQNFYKQIFLVNALQKTFTENTHRKRCFTQQRQCSLLLF
ncbi:hypothetical protein HMPREF9554_00948 [Treponema phagedenis F0421]|nr:hypothetical protein HMPREF9554_00948 [Treponema phagedenis F0421]